MGGRRCPRRGEEAAEARAADCLHEYTQLEHPVRVSRVRRPPERQRTHLRRHSVGHQLCKCHWIQLDVACTVKVSRQLLQSCTEWCASLPVSTIFYYHHVPQFLKLAASSALMICLRFWTLEFLVLLSGILPNPKLETSAFSITRNTSAIVTMISVGLSTPVSIRVSNELGAGRPKEARKVISIAFFIATSEGLSISLLLVLLRNVWGKVYRNETEVVKYVANMLPLVAIGHLFDSTQCLFSGTLRGCGLQKTGAIIIIGTMYMIGVPLSVVLGFVVHLRAKGFWIGFIIVLCVQDLIFGMVCLSINWESLAAKAKERVYISITQKENVPNREDQTVIAQLKGVRSMVLE